MAEQQNNKPLNIGLPLFETNEEYVNKKKSGIEVGYSGIMSKAFTIRYKTNPQGMKPLDLLEELAKLRSDESLTREEKNLRIKKMLDME